jgi:hypothetical protein
LYEGEYLICSEQRSVPNDQLWLKPSSSVSIYLRDGTMLMERGMCETYKKGVPQP